MTVIDFYFDFASPYAYLARHALAEIAERRDAIIAYHPVDLKALKTAAGNFGPPTVQIPPKLAFANRDFERWSTRYGIPFKGIRSNKARDLNVGCLYAIEKGMAARYVEEGFKAGWGSNGALDNPALIASVATACSFDLDDFLSFIARPQAETHYQAIFETAVSRQVFGVPTMIVGRELWWGNDRLFMLDEYLGDIASARVA